MKNKNNTLDFIKAIACVMVLFIHIKFPNEFGYYVSAVARFAVPFFFMVSGYFSYKKDNDSVYIFRQLKKIIILSILSLLLYFTFSYIISIYNSDLVFIHNAFNFENLKYFILFNSLPFGTHLWYLFSLIYVYIVYYIFKKLFKNVKILYIFIPIFLIMCIIIEYSIFSGFIFYQNIVIRNFLFIGLPFFMLGNLICKHKYSNFMMLLDNRILFLTSVFGCFYSLFEAYCSTYMDLYFGSILFSVSIFILGVKNENYICDNNIICKFGRYYSLGIYIIHCIFISIYNIFIYDVGDIFVQWCAPFVVLLLSFITVYSYYKIKNKLIYKLKKN